MNKKLLLVALLLLVGMASRFIPHYPNFTAIGAVAIFAGSTSRKLLESLVIPLLTLLISDVILNNFIYASGGFQLFYDGAFYVYLPVLLLALVSRSVHRLTPSRFGILAVIFTVVFFLISNYGVWLTGLTYPLTNQGLLACYVAALPYALNTLAGTLVYGFVIVTAYNLATEQRGLKISRL